MTKKKKEEITDIPSRETSKPVRMIDVARRAGVSVSTVSRVLNGIKTDFISKETERKINEIAYTMGYKKNVFAQALTGGKTFLIDLQIPALYYHMLNEFSVLASETDYTVISRDIEQKYLFNKDIVNLSVDGVISIVDGGLLESYMKSLPHKNCVSIGRNCSNKFDYIYEDFYEGTCEAIEYLIKKGAKKIAYLTDDLMVLNREEKVRAYLTTLEKYGLKPYFINTNGWAPNEIYNGVMSELKKETKIDAILCHSDVRHKSCINAIKDFGLKIPKDISVVTSGHIMGKLLDIKKEASGVYVEDTIICKKAWEFLMNRIENPKIPIQKYVAKYKFYKGITTK